MMTESRRPEIGSILVAIAMLVGACRPPGYGKGPPDDGGIELDAGGDGDAARAIDSGPAVDAGFDAAPVRCDAAFRLEGHGAAASVWLTGDFVDWAGTPAAGAAELVQGDAGVWTITLPFAGGMYLYKFIVDGASWIPDPGNPETLDDGFGNLNSVYRCEAS